MRGSLRGIVSLKDKELFENELYADFSSSEEKINGFIGNYVAQDNSVTKMIMSFLIENSQELADSEKPIKLSIQLKDLTAKHSDKLDFREMKAFVKSKLEERGYTYEGAPLDKDSVGNKLLVIDCDISKPIEKIEKIIFNISLEREKITSALEEYETTSKVRMFKMSKQRYHNPILGKIEEKLTALGKTGNAFTFFDLLSIFDECPKNPQDKQFFLKTFYEYLHHKTSNNASGIQEANGTQKVLANLAKKFATAYGQFNPKLVDLHFGWKSSGETKQFHELSAKDFEDSRICRTFKGQECRVYQINSGPEILYILDSSAVTSLPMPEYKEKYNGKVEVVDACDASEEIKIVGLGQIQTTYVLDAPFSDRVQGILYAYEKNSVGLEKTYFDLTRLYYNVSSDPFKRGYLDYIFGIHLQSLPVGDSSLFYNPDGSPTVLSQYLPDLRFCDYRTSTNLAGWRQLTLPVL